MAAQSSDERRQPAADYPSMMEAIFQGRDPGGVLWQPRLEFWYAVNKKRGTLPEPLQNASILDVYDYCHASVRYFGGQGLQVRRHNVRVTETWLDEKQLQRTWETPIGALREIVHHDEWGLSGHLTEYKVKTIEDFAILEYILEDEEWFWDQEAFEREMALFGDYGLPQFYFRRSPIQNLFISEMGFMETIYAMHDHPQAIQRYVEAQTAADDAMYEVICRCPAPLVNFGENIDAFMDTPPIWLEHHVPYYQRRTEQLHAADKYVYIHIDGAMKPLLPYLQLCPWDGIEAATPVPQGDVTLAEIEQGLGDQILLDGIPALFFLPSFAEDDLIRCTEEVIERFQPRLVLGISDEIPPDGDIERVRMVGELAAGLA